MIGEDESSPFAVLMDEPEPDRGPWESWLRLTGLTGPDRVTLRGDGDETVMQFEPLLVGPVPTWPVVISPRRTHVGGGEGRGLFGAAVEFAGDGDLCRAAYDALAERIGRQAADCLITAPGALQAQWFAVTYGKWNPDQQEEVQRGLARLAAECAEAVGGGVKAVVPPGLRAPTAGASVEILAYQGGWRTGWNRLASALPDPVLELDEGEVTTATLKYLLREEGRERGEAIRAARDGDYTGFQPADLAAALLEPVPVPVLLERADRECGMYRGKCHTIAGEFESAKTWIALLSAKQALETGYTVAWLDWEDEAVTFAQRLRVLGVSAAVIASDRVRYLRPSHVLDDRAWEMIARALDGADLVVVDGTSDAMAAQGLNPFAGNDDSAVRWGQIMRRFSALAPDAAVVNIDHVPKNQEGRGRSPIGGQHKGAGLDGPLFIVDKVLAPFGIGLLGSCEIKVAKDRPGMVRAQAGEMDDHRLQPWGTFFLDSRRTPDPSACWIEPWNSLVSLSASAENVVTPLMIKVYAFVQERYDLGKTTSKDDIEHGVEGKRGPVRDAIGKLVKTGCLDDTGVGKAWNGTYFIPVNPPEEWC